MNNLVGKKFGFLLVLSTKNNISHCLCERCGKKRDINNSLLLSGRRVSCGCYRGKSPDLKGMKFGYLTVIKLANIPHSNSTWECICECGKTHLAKRALLANGHVKSCGCHKSPTKGKIKNNLTGKRFGKLYVVEIGEIKHNHRYYLCKCDCGTIKYISGQHIKNGQKSCGCLKGFKTTHGLSGNRKEYNKYLMKDPHRKLRQTISNQIRKAIKSNNSNKNNNSITKYLPYTISELKKHIENLWEPWMMWENYGGRANDTRKTWWIDHIIPQSSFIYQSMEDKDFLECWSLSNLRPLEKIANIKKGNK